MPNKIWDSRGEAIFNALPYLMAIINSEGIVVYVNDAMLALMGLERGIVEGKPYWELDCWLHSDDVQNRVLFAMEQSAVTDDEVRMESQFKDARGHMLDIDFHIRALYDSEQQETFFLSTGFNVTALVLARRALSEKERQMQALFDYSEEGFYMNVLPEGLSPELGEEESSRGMPNGKSLEDRLIDDFITYQKIVRYNRAFKAMLGYNPEEPLPGNRMYDLLQIHGRHYRDLMRKLLKEGEIKLEHTLTDRHGNEKILHLYMVLIKQDNYYYGNFGVIRDLTVQRHYERELQFFAFQDPLTGLENRRTFFQKAKHHYDTEIKSGVVLMMDIDHFKKVNDTYGHSVGDEVLIGFANQLSELAPANAHVARYGGEEFVLLLLGYTLEEACSWSEDLLVAARERAYKSENGDVFHITVSIGITEIRPVDGAVDATITRADKALYVSKQSGRNRYTICSDNPADYD